MTASASRWLVFLAITVIVGLPQIAAAATVTPVPEIAQAQAAARTNLILCRGISNRGTSNRGTANRGGP